MVVQKTDRKTDRKRKRQLEGERERKGAKNTRGPDNSAVKSGLKPAGAEFFPGCLPLVSDHICLEFLLRAPRGPLHSNYFNLTKHLIYFISPMRKAVCLNRACQPPEPIQGNLLAGLSEPQFASLCLCCLLQWKRAAILHLSS